MELTKTKYKQTEVGMIPIDWEVSTLDEVTTLMTNGFVGTATTEYTEERDGVLYIQGYNVEANSFNFNGIKRVNQSFHKRHLKSTLKEGDLLTVQTGDVGLTTIVSKELEGSNCHALIISRFKSNKVYPWFYAQYFNSYTGRSRLKELEIGTTMKHLNVGDMKNWQIPLPPTLTEQKAIATALSDVDDLIANLDKLITKKKAIKQGAMQQLLTPPHKGGKRLAGYTGEWVEKKLGDCLKYEQPTKYIVENSDYEGQSQIPVLTAGKSFLLGYTDEDFGVFNHHPVIIFDDFTTSNQFVNFSFKVKSSAMKMLQPVTEEINVEFMFSIMNQIRFSLGDDHKRRWIAEYSKIEVFVPEIEEQKAIAQILTDMDLEIEQLETKKAKYQDIKQGMMQELLTGKTRLV